MTNQDFTKTLTGAVIVVAVGIMITVMVLAVGSILSEPSPSLPDVIGGRTMDHAMCFEIDHRTASGPAGLCVTVVLNEEGTALRWYPVDANDDWRMSLVGAEG